MTAFATLQDMCDLWRQIKPDEQVRVENLLVVVSDLLRAKAKNVGKDLDAMIKSDSTLVNVVKSVTVDIVARNLNTPTDQQPMSQFSESALGYSVSGTYLVPGGGLYIKKEELAKLGLKKQRFGVIDFYGD